MRFTCEKNMLVTGLNIAGRTVAQKSSLSVIEGILCKAGQGLSLTGYNMETAITYEIDADVSDMGQCILPAKLFGDIIRRLPEGPVTVVVDENYKVSIRAGYASFTISAESAEDYPELPDVGDGREIYIPQNKLKELISGTIFAVSENQGRPIHTGVKFEVTNDAITAVAVDGFRLARRTFHPEEGTGRELNFVVPAAGLKEVEKILTDVEDNAAFTLGTKHILFQVGNATLVCRLLEGEFLDWRRVVPSNCPIKMVANVGDLASSVERVGLIVSEKYKSPVRCVFGNQELLMRTSTTIGAAEDRCSLAGDGQELEIGFNVRYLAEALRVMNQKIKDREIDKRYLAIVEGSPKPKEGSLKGYLFKDAQKNRVYVTDTPQPGSKTCQTNYKTLASAAGLSLVECELITGRTHQIRAQFAHAGHPLLGDGKYGKLDKRFDRSYQALYSYKLTFTFTTDAGALDYLNGKSFQVEKVDFAEQYFPDVKI